MRGIRRHLRAWAVSWMVFQAASLSVLVPRDCCASHRPASPAPGCHQEAAPAPHCPMPAADGTPCPMHERNAHGSKDDCVLRGSCDGPAAALAVLLPGHSVPAERIAFLPHLASGGSVSPEHVNPVGHPVPPDTPPPRA
jgi:hypothetical protein